MKLMQMVAAVTMTAALALGTAGCAKKEEAKPGAAADAAKQKGADMKKSLEGAAEKAPAAK